MKKSGLATLALGAALAMGCGSSPSAPTPTAQEPIEIPVTIDYKGPFFKVSLVRPGRNTTVEVGQRVEVEGKAYIPYDYMNKKEGWIDTGVFFVRDDGSDGRCLADSVMGSSGYHEQGSSPFVETHDFGVYLTDRMVKSDIVCGGKEGCEKFLSGHELNAVMYMTKPGKSHMVDNGYYYNPAVGYICNIAWDNLLQHEFVKLGIKVK